MPTWQKIVFGGIAVLLFLLILVLIFVNVYINQTVPKVSGEEVVRVLQSDVRVTYDRYGVPHIEASKDADLFRAQGYVQAKERLFQMSMARRQASGTLSEVVGEQAVEQDKYFRTLGLRRAAERSYASYSPEMKEVLQYYSEGVNAFIEEAIASKRLPVEFALVGFSPSEWDPIDSLTIGKYMAFDLGGHWERQAFNYHLLQQYGEEKAYELFPSYPKQAPTIVKDINIGQSFSSAIIPEEFNGSNNWVVSGEKTASGKPLLADDPHLGLATPSIWYEMHLQSPNYNVNGVVFAGVPGIILGHNDEIAWGVTNVGPDVQQLYLEKRHPDEAYTFMYEGEWEKAKVIQEPINVKGEDTIPYTVVETRHGPILSEFAGQSDGEHALALRWTALDATTELEAFLDVNKAKNWNEFEDALAKFHAPAQNFVFTSKDGTIAYKANGKIPIYPDGKDALLPLEGWNAENEWVGYIPYDELPTVINPEQGFIATANNKVVGPDYPYHISHVFAQPYRYARIHEFLEENNHLTVNDMKELQMDVKNLQAEEFVPLFVSKVRNGEVSETMGEALSILEKWDYKDEATQSAPLIFHTWMDHVEEELYKDLSSDVRGLFTGKGQTTDELLRQSFSGEDPQWVQEAGGLEELLTKSLKSSIEELYASFGSELTAMSWGEFHRVEFYHPLSSISYLEPFFNSNSPVPSDGSAVTVMAASHNEEGIVNHGASWRFVFDGSTYEKSEQMVGPGQSGHVKSVWYDNQRKDWVEGGYHTTYLSGYKGQVLTLTAP
ncbi:penicillin acylase family protein [Pontibacillus halophilus]|nr:penicillin acylase family protein [Pontibacillus halophilus]